MARSTAETVEEEENADAGRILEKKHKTVAFSNIGLECGNF